MTVTGTLDIDAVTFELAVFLRNADVISTAERGVTTTIEEFDGDNSTTEFTVSNTNIKNVRSVTVGGVAQTFGNDYTVDYETATITFTSAPPSGTDNVDIQYDYGNSDKIFTDFPKIELSVDSYPRIAIQATSIRSEEGSVDGDVIFNNYLLSIYVYNTGTTNTNSIIKAIRVAILEARKDFYYTRYLSPAGTGPTIPQPERGDKIYLKTSEWIAPLNEEIIS